MRYSILALMLLSVPCYAYEMVPFDIGACATGAAVTVTVPKVTGKLVYSSLAATPVTSGTTSTVAVVTTAATGSTAGAARTVLSTTTLTTAAVSSNLATVVYLYADDLVVTFTNTGTNAVTASKGVLILEKP